MKKTLALVLLLFLFSLSSFNFFLKSSQNPKETFAQGCQDDDGVCPEGCTPGNDNDCSAYKTFNLYWGDIHGHTHLSDGDESPDFYYDYAKNVARLNFAAITDHAFRISNYPDDWNQIISISNSYNSPGDFITLIGFEWSGKGEPDGHKNVYYKNEGPLITSNREINSQPLSLAEAKSANDLWNALNNYDALTIPHHTLAKHCEGSGLENIPMSTDWSHRNDEIQRLAEIYSKWGSSEHQGLALARPEGCYVEGKSIQDALSMGHKLGFVGGSDTHLSKPGSQDTPEKVSSALIYEDSGLTAVYTNSLTRNKIFDALKNRRTYTTSGARIKLEFSSGNHLMGEEFTNSGNPKFKIYVKPDGSQLEFVKIIKGWIGRQTPFQPPEIDTCHNTDECFLEWEDLNFNKNSFYYLRVKQVDGHVAWSSPIWINYPTPFSLFPGWNQITWPDVSGKKASDIPIECPIAVSKDGFWLKPYVKNFGGVNFNFEKDRVYYLKCNQGVVWNP